MAIEDVMVPRTTVKFGKKDYLLIFDLYGFMQLETLGDSIEDILAEAEKKPMSRLVDFIWAFALESHPDIVKNEIAKGVPIQHMIDAMKVVMELIPKAMAQLKGDFLPDVIDNSSDPLATTQQIPEKK